MDNVVLPRYKVVIAEISNLNWAKLNSDELHAVAAAYYYFSIQFRENLLVALSTFPEDKNLQHLAAEECATSNLSPWPGVAEPGERMNHDEFMRRTLMLSSLPPDTVNVAEIAGKAYLEKSRSYDPDVRARSIASYEDGGLEATFRAMLMAPDWNGATLEAFRHFLVEHIRFDSDPDQGHGALSRHLQADDRVLPLWADFRDLLICAVPRLATEVSQMAV
ncbi:MAG: hypothetical protein KGQ69_00465 [Rhodospirillales bacterium]|nr:hypothetical protein [Rhodospirillales bacterium]